MNKVAIVGDIHLGKKNNDRVKKDRILKSQDDFFNFFLAECIKNEINEVIWTGDIFDTQNSIESPIIQYAVELFSEKLGHMRHHIIVGNHDIFLRDSMAVSSLACLEKLSNVTVYRKLTKVKIAGHNILMTPYLVSDLYSKFSGSISKIGEKCEIVVGHFDIIGAKMENGFVSEFGLDMNSILKNIKLTISGHYHNISKYALGDNTLQYVGTPYQLTFGDASQDRGFWLLDENRELEFIENNVSAKFIKFDISEINSIGDISNHFIKCTYPSNISDEELFRITKTISDKTPISFSTEPKQIKNISEIDMLEDEKITEILSSMCDALNIGDFLAVCDVFIEVEPPKNAKLVKQLLIEIKSKVKK